MQVGRQRRKGAAAIPPRSSTLHLVQVGKQRREGAAARAASLEATREEEEARLAAMIDQYSPPPLLFTHTLSLSVSLALTLARTRSLARSRSPPQR